MWTLRSSGPSPFGRKVKIGASLCGLSDRITIEATDTTDPAESFVALNPLGKIPTLVLEDGTVLYDSRVILEWLDYQAGGGRIIPGGQDRFAALTQQALGDGIMDASLLIVYESRMRPEERRHAPWVERQAAKVARGLRFLEADPPELAETPHVGQIAVACALGYRDLRFNGDWRADHPRLVAWLEEFSAQVPSFEATKAH